MLFFVVIKNRNNLKCYNLRILIIGPLPNPIDGCSFANKVFCENLEKRNIIYDTINTNVKEVSSQQGSNFSLKKALGFFNVYFEIFKLKKAKIVYFTPGQTFFGLLKYAPFITCCQLINIPYVIHVHGNYLGEQYRLLKGVKKRVFEGLIKKASAGIVLSESLKDNFKDLLAADKVHVVENFVPNDIFENIKIDSRNRNSLQIVYLSNLMKGKGVLDVLDALLLLKNKNIIFQAIFAGKIEKEIEGVINEKLTQLAGVAEYIGVVKGGDKVELFNKSNVFVLPTYYQMEGQPISILEAMASGNIIITTKHAGIPDVMSTENGFFVEKKSPRDIAEIFEVISNNLVREINRVELENIKKAKKNYTEEQFSNNILSVIENILNE